MSSSLKIEFSIFLSFLCTLFIFFAFLYCTDALKNSRSELFVQSVKALNATRARSAVELQPIQYTLLFMLIKQNLCQNNDHTCRDWGPPPPHLILAIEQTVGHTGCFF